MDGSTAIRKTVPAHDQAEAIRPIKDMLRLIARSRLMSGVDRLNVIDIGDCGRVSRLQDRQRFRPPRHSPACISVRQSRRIEGVTVHAPQSSHGTSGENCAYSSSKIVRISRASERPKHIHITTTIPRTDRKDSAPADHALNGHAGQRDHTSRRGTATAEDVTQHLRTPEPRCGNSYEEHHWRIPSLSIDAVYPVWRIRLSVTVFCGRRNRSGRRAMSFRGILMEHLSGTIGRSP